VDDPALDAVLATLDRKRHKSIPPPEVEKIWLVVSYDRKDEAKKIGARWSPADRSWWLPAANAEVIDKARTLDSTPRVIHRRAYQVSSGASPKHRPVYRPRGIKKGMWSEP
jgi:hypothetical protein